MVPPVEHFSPPGDFVNQHPDSARPAFNRTPLDDAFVIGLFAFVPLDVMSVLLDVASVLAHVVSVVLPDAFVNQSTIFDR